MLKVYFKSSCVSIALCTVKENMIISKQIPPHTCNHSKTVRFSSFIMKQDQASLRQRLQIADALKNAS